MSRFVPQVRPMSKRDIEEVTVRIIRTHYPLVLSEPRPFPVLDFFDHVLRDEYHLDPAPANLGPGVEGMTLPDGRVLVDEQVYRGAAAGIGRDRFTVLHEGFHGILHRDQVNNECNDLALYRRTDVPRFRDPEWQANYGAAALLMPEKTTAELAIAVPRYELIEAIIDTFQVSHSAATIRAKQLEL